MKQAEAQKRVKMTKGTAVANVLQSDVETWTAAGWKVKAVEIPKVEKK